MQKIFKPRELGTVTRRELAVLGALYRYRFLTSKLLHRLLFRNAGIRVAQRSIKKLVDLGFVGRRRVFKLIDSDNPLSTGWTIYLEGRGGELLGVEDLEGLDRRNSVSVEAVNHFLLTNQFMVELEIACELSSCGIVEHEDELELRADHDKVLLKSGGKERAIIPDTHVAISRPHWVKPTRFLLEIDTGHEKLKVIRDKARKYLAYFETKQIYKRFGSHIRVLFVTEKGERRVANLKHQVERVGGKGRFWFGSFKTLCAENLFDRPVWYRAGLEERVTLLPTKPEGKRLSPELEMTAFIVMLSLESADCPA